MAPRTEQAAGTIRGQHRLHLGGPDGRRGVLVQISAARNASLRQSGAARAVPLAS